MRSDYKDPTLSELLEDPLVLLLMTRDGITHSDIKALMAAMRARSIDHDKRSKFLCLQPSTIPDSVLTASH